MKAFVVISGASGVLAASVPARRSNQIWATPHDSYSSSIGVLGCKVDTDRIAYWPSEVGCDNICVKVHYEDRSVTLLKVDTSGGAHDMSYDAWNYLITGKGARESPTTGGATGMWYEDVDADKCKDLIKTKGGKLPLSACNSMNYLSNCLTNYPNSWVAKNYELFNILDPICTLGHDDACKLDWPNANQATCPTQLGVGDQLSDQPVWNVQYSTGKLVLAGSPSVVVDAGDVESKGSTGASTPSVSVTVPSFGGSKASTSVAVPTSSPPANKDTTPIFVENPQGNNNQGEQSETEPLEVENEPVVDSTTTETPVGSPSPSAPYSASEEGEVGTAAADVDTSSISETQASVPTPNKSGIQQAPTPTAILSTSAQEKGTTTIYVPLSAVIPVIVGMLVCLV